MNYSKIRCEDIESCTLREAIVEYGNDIKPLWQECVYSRPYKLESRRYIGCKAKLTDWIFDILQKQTHNVHSFCDIFAGTGSVSNKAIHLYNNVIMNDFLYSNNIMYKAFFGIGTWDKKNYTIYLMPLTESIQMTFQTIIFLLTMAENISMKIQQN